MGGVADARATGIAEAHAEFIVGVLKKVDDAECSMYIKRKLVPALWSGINSRRSQTDILLARRSVEKR